MATITGTEPGPGQTGEDDLSSSNEGDEILGLGGNDVLAANAAHITLDGGAGDDQLFSFNDDATLIGGPGNDFLSGIFGTNDTASYAGASAGVTVDLSAEIAIDDGDGGFDELFGIENVTGSLHDDTLTGDDLANVLQGGAGNDTLTGNGGADVFKFSFDIEQGSGGGGTPLSFGDWLTAENALDIGNLRQNEFVQNYIEWLGYLAEELRENHGFDTIPENAMVSFKQNDPDGMPTIEGLTQAELGQIFGDATAISVKTGKTTQERYYSDIDTSSGIWGGSSEDTLTSDDGFDKILDFEGLDTLNFSGITEEQFLDSFNVDSSLDVFGDSRVDTVITFDGIDDWSVTLSGVSDFDFANDAVFS